jgi:hypothetical protein
MMRTMCFVTVCALAVSAPQGHSPPPDRISVTPSRSTTGGSSLDELGMP